MSNDNNPNQSGCVIAVISAVIFLVVGSVATKEAGIFVGGWVALIAAIIVYFVLAKLLSE